MSNVNRELEALEAEIERLQSLFNELNEELFSANMTIANYETEKENRWISVKDHLPEEEGKYLICCSDGYRTTAEYENKTWLVYTGRYEEVEDVTHWMPLPEPPKGDDDE